MGICEISISLLVAIILIVALDKIADKHNARKY